jgi:hypothetical protein
MVYPLEGVMESGKTEIEFDCTDAHWAVEQLGKIFYDRDEVLGTYAAMGAQIHIDFFGPGGGNPCVTVYNINEEVADRVREFLVHHGLSWSEGDQIFDYTWDMNGPLDKCDKCWQPKEYCEVHR